MTQTEIQPEKIRAYEAANYCAGSGADALVLRIGQHSPVYVGAISPETFTQELGFAESAVVFAFNVLELSSIDTTPSQREG